MLTCFGNCHQIHVVMDADSHMLSWWKLSDTCCHDGAVSHMLSWMMTRTCGDECWQSLLCHVGSCQSHIVMDADSHMDAVSHLLTSTCYQQMLSLMLAVNYFVMLMLSVKCCQIRAARHIIFSSRCMSSVDADRHCQMDAITQIKHRHIYSHKLPFRCSKLHVVNCVLSVTCCLPHTVLQYQKWHYGSIILQFIFNCGWRSFPFVYTQKRRTWVLR